VNTSAIQRAIALSSALFIAMLAVSAWFDSSIRWLHVFEALPYAAAPWLCRTKPKFGFILSFAAGIFWIWTAGFLTRFVRGGFERLITLVQTGHVDRPDILLAVPAFLGTLGMAVFALIGYSRLENKKPKDFLVFLGAFIGILIFFIAISAAFTPRFLEIFDRLFK
jgi:hypothetical protein